MIDTSKNWGRHKVVSTRQVMREGERSDQCLILLTGMLAQERLLVGGGRQITGVYLPGDICGLNAIFEGTAACGIIAPAPVTCLAVCRHWLSAIIHERPDLRQASWREMSRELAIAAAWIANIGQRSAYERIAHLLCELAARWRLARNDERYDFEWFGTQADIAAATGLSLVHVNKTFRRLEAEGLASWDRAGPAIYDAAKLEAVAGFDAAYLQMEEDRLSTLLARLVSSDRAEPADGAGVVDRFDPNPVPLRMAI